MPATAPETTLFPFGVVTQAEVINIIRSICIEDEVKNLQAIIEEWRNASNHFQEIIQTENGLAETIDSKGIDPLFEAKLKEITSDLLFQQTFSHYQIEFKLVEIEKLIAAQRSVNLDYVQALKSRLTPNPRIEDLIDFCLANKQVPPVPKVQQIAQNAFSYSSESSQFRFLGGYPKPLTMEDIIASNTGGLPAAAIVLLLGYGSPVCNVWSVNGRMVLNNGFHRMFTLGEIGIKYAPVVVQKITSPDLEFPSSLLGLPKDYLIKHPRPVIMRDFFDPNLVKVIHKKPTIMGVQISWNVNQSPFPI
jgi:hypothetical protein